MGAIQAPVAWRDRLLVPSDSSAGGAAQPWDAVATEADLSAVGWGIPLCPSHRKTAYEEGALCIVSGSRHWNLCQELSWTFDPTGSCLLCDGSPPSCCVTLGKALPLSENNFPHM